jgi:hypothetical protein
VANHKPGIAAPLFAAVLVLAGCNAPAGALNQPSGGVALGWYPPWTLYQSPGEIVLRWYPDVTPSLAADQAARRHCGAWEKSAELVSTSRDGSAEIAQYRCR